MTPKQAGTQEPPPAGVYRLARTVVNPKPNPDGKRVADLAEWEAGALVVLRPYRGGAPSTLAMGNLCATRRNDGEIWDAIIPALRPIPMDFDTWAIFHRVSYHDLRCMAAQLVREGMTFDELTALRDRARKVQT